MLKNTKLDFKDQEIFVGLDVHTKEFEHKTFSQNPDPDVLISYLQKHFLGAKYCCAYEAGYCGFWILISLLRKG